jgi:hypothetical protein
MRPNSIKITVTAAASFFSLTTDLRAQEVATVPEVEITGTGPGVLRQGLQVGQPEWTTERAFSNSRVYVRPAGTFEFNQFWTPEFAEGHLCLAFCLDANFLRVPRNCIRTCSGSDLVGRAFASLGCST